jgi:polyphenol oxidase
VTGKEDGCRLNPPLAERIDPAARSRMVVREFDGVPVLEASLPRPFRALFTTRLGGESVAPFAGLNLSPFVGDEPEVVARNRAFVHGLVERRLVSPKQEHGLRVMGAAEYVLEAPDTPCDGLTAHFEIDKGLAPLLLFADCVPVVLCGEVDLAVAHGGWRGILGGIVQQAGRSLMGMPGMAVIGPSIGPCCFTVDDDVATAFADRFGDKVVVSSDVPGEAKRVDLWAATTQALTEINIHPSQITNPRLCTVCNNDVFYSYRAEGPVAGRQGCVAWAMT